MAGIKGDGIDKDGQVYGGINGANNVNVEPGLTSSSWFTGCFLTAIGYFNSDGAYAWQGKTPEEGVLIELESGIPVPPKVVYTTCFLATLNANTHTKAIAGLKGLGWQEVFRCPGSHCSYSKHQEYYKKVAYYEMVILVCLCPPDFHIQGWKFLRDRLPATTVTKAATISERVPRK